MNLNNKLIEIVNKNDTIKNILDHHNNLCLNNWYIAAGCIAQTVWNVLTKREISYGIEDYDLVYFDSSDTSHEAEDLKIKHIEKVFPGIKFDIKNEARVHLRYESKFGKKIEPYKSIEGAINSFPTTATTVGITIKKNDLKVIHSAFGLEDLFSLTVRANKKQITKEIFEKKCQKRLSKRPELKIIHWDE